MREWEDIGERERQGVRFTEEELVVVVGGEIGDGVNRRSCCCWWWCVYVCVCVLCGVGVGDDRVGWERVGAQFEGLARREPRSHAAAGTSEDKVQGHWLKDGSAHPLEFTMPESSSCRRLVGRLSFSLEELGQDSNTQDERQQWRYEREVHDAQPSLLAITALTPYPATLQL
jgi:hypothetical protein